MSRTSKLTLILTSAVAIGTVGFVHWSQDNDKAAMHAGVVRDMERQRVKRERVADFEMQKALEKEYRELQSVHSASGGKA